MALHRLHQVGQRSPQAFPRNTVGGFPDHDHRCSDALIVAAPASPGMRCAFIIVKLAEQPDAMLAMVAGHRGELVEDPALVLLGRRPVAVSDRRSNFCFAILLMPCMLGGGAVGRLMPG